MMSAAVPMGIEAASGGVKEQMEYVVFTTTLTIHYSNAMAAGASEYTDGLVSPDLAKSVLSSMSPEQMLKLAKFMAELN